MYKVVIVEDEINALEALKGILFLLKKQVEIVGEFPSVKESAKYLSKNTVDILFLDIELEDGNSFDLLKQLDELNSEIIFTTAFSNHSLEAIKANALDYILKPIIPEELSTAIDKAIVRIKNKELLKQVSFDTKILTIRSSNNLHRIPMSEIILITADGSYTKIKTDDKEILASKNIKYFEDILKEWNFIRPHQSYLVNLKHIAHYSSDGEIILNTKEKVPVSFRNRKYIAKRIQEQ